MKKLVILESPNKIRKVQAFLNNLKDGNVYIVKASVGHVRTLSDSGEHNIGLNLSTIEPNFIISSDKKSVVRDLIANAADVDQIVLATDPDREGEVIAWHLKEILRPYCYDFKRLKLNAISQSEVDKKIKLLESIDQNYVNAGLARSYLDKITGYILSHILQIENVGVSAGRIQSVVLQILCSREEVIKNFIEEQWYVLEDNINGVNFKNVDNEKNIIKYESFLKINTVRQNLNLNYEVSKIEKDRFEDKPFINFTTSDYLKAAKNKLKLGVNRATEVAQSLFEKGLITYIRTDSTTLDPVDERFLLKYVSEKYGAVNTVTKIPTRKEKATDQEGHPPITPTHFEWEPENIQNHPSEVLSDDEKKVYRLIWQNTINSALKVPSGSKTTYFLKNDNLLFLASTKEYENMGYFQFDHDLKKPDSTNLNWKLNDLIPIQSPQIVLQKASPLPRFNEATLISTLEKNGIGRPSTYKTMVEVNFKRKYIFVDKRDSMCVLPSGFTANSFLQSNFAEIINVEFTKNMEHNLDLIAKGQLDFKKYVKDYYQKLSKLGEKYMVNIVLCPKCGKGLFKKKDYDDAPFQCSDFKTCGYIEAPENAKKCGDENCNGKVYVVKYNDKKTGEVKSFEKCTNRDCLYNPDAVQKCPSCKVGWLIKRNYTDKKTGQDKMMLACNNDPKKCGLVDWDYHE